MGKRTIILFLIILYILKFSMVFAFTPGTKQWEFATSNSVSSSPAIGDDGTIYVGSDDRKLYAVNPDGTKKWAVGTNGYVSSSPAIGDDGTIYVGSDNGTYYNRPLIYAINPDGTKKWAFGSFGKNGRVKSSPAIGDDGTVYVGTDDNKLYAINPDGTKKWEFETNAWVRSSPAIGYGGTIYIGSWDNKFYAVNPDGTKKWEFVTDGNVDSSPAIGSDGTIYVGSDDKKLYAINPDGSKKWDFATGNAVSSSPAIGSDGTIYVVSSSYFSGRLYAINANGTKKWDFSLNGAGDSSPAIGSDGAIYVGSGANKLYAINPNGTKKWEFVTDNGVSSSPAIGSDGAIYVGSADNRLYAIYSDSKGLATGPWPKFKQNNLNTGMGSLSFFVEKNNFDMFTQGEIIEISITISNSLSEDIVITGYDFDQSVFSLNSSLPLTLSAGSSKRLTVLIEPQSTDFYNSRCTLSYELDNASLTDTFQTGAGLFLDDDSELACMARKALDAYHTAYAENPYSIATKNNLGVLYRLLGEPETAEKMFVDAVSKSLNARYGYTGIKMNIGVVHSDQSDSTNASDYYDSALIDISGDETNSAIAPQLYYNMAWEAYNADDMTSALNQANQTLSHAKVNDFLAAKAHVLRGAIFMAKGDETSANADFLKAITFDSAGPIGRMAQFNYNRNNIEPGQPLLISPFEAINGEAPVFRWYKDSHATWYQLLIRNSSEERIHNEWYEASDICSGNCSVTLESELLSGTYEWWVKSWNATGSVWSDGMNFTVQESSSSKVTLIAPSGITGPSPTFSWNEDENATWYYLFVWDSAKKKVHTGWYKTSDICSGGNCEVTLASELLSDDYEWWVKTWNETGQVWSDGMRFTVQGTSPSKVILAAPSGITGPSPAFSWKEGENATWYYLFIWDSAKKKVHTKWYKTSDICSGGNCEVTLASELLSDDYEWWVKSWSESGDAWSDGMNFTVSD